MIRIKRFVSFGDDGNGGVSGKYLDLDPIVVPNEKEALRRCFEHLEDIGVATGAVGISCGYEVRLPSGRLVIRITYAIESSD